MGFDIECILDITAYPGEYFCPVCRALVNPKEALQAQCTHLYCKPCLSYIANSSRACPYDGYLVTESDSKPLVDVDKTLSENIGKVKVHCLYFRSGCTWEGALSDCISHCSECSWGNSLVICNKCGIQIVHRQVHHHAQSCPSLYEAQQVAGTVSGAMGSGTTSSTTTTELNQTVSQSEGPLSQNPQIVPATLMPGQNYAQQVNTNTSSQTAVVAPGAVPTPEQWYHQQYQQYYQQCVAYEAYEQPNQQYYPLQQQPFKQYPQHPTHVQGQHQSHAHTQAPWQVQVQPQQQPQLQPYPAPQATQQHIQPQAQGQAQPQGQGQNQPHPQVQFRPQAQLSVPIPPQGQAHVHAPYQASTPNYQVNPHQQHHPPLRPQTQIPLHSLPPPPHGQPAPYSQPMGTRPPMQHPQVAQYQQHHVQMHHPQATQTHAQPQMNSYPQPHTQLPPPPPPPPPQPHIQTLNQSYVQPQAQLHHAQSQYLRPSQSNERNVPASLPQVPLQPVPPVSGYHSYQPPHPAQQMQSGFSQQHPMHPHPSSGSLHPVQVQGQVPQQPLPMPPPHSLVSLPHKQSIPLPPQIQVSGIQPTHYQQFYPHVQQPGHPLQHCPVVQPVPQVVPQQYAQQQPFITPFQGQQHHQGHFPQQPLQLLRPNDPPHPQQSQDYAGRPMIPSPGRHVHSNQQSCGRTGPVPAQLTSREASTVQSKPESTIEKGSEVEPLNTEAVTGQYETVSKNEEKVAKDGLALIKQEGGGVDGCLEQASGGKSLKGDEFHKEESDLLTGSDGLKQVNIRETKLPKTVIECPSFTNLDENSQTVVSASSTEHHELPPKSNGSYPAQPPLIIGNQGPRNLSHPGQSFNPNEGREHGYFGPPPESFESQSTPQGPPFAAFPDPHGINGKSLQPRLEASGSIDKAPHGPNCDAGLKFDPGALGSQSRFLPQHHSFVEHARMDNLGSGPEFGQRQMKHFAPGSLDHEYHGISPRGYDVPTFDDKNAREAHKFGEGNMRFGEHAAHRPPHNHIRSDDFYGQDGPGHLMGGEFSGPGYLSGGFNTGETHGPRAFLGHAQVTELGGPRNFSTMRNNYSFQGFPSAASSAWGVDSFDPSRKRRPMSTRWCRICKVDCETVEGLDMHSQTKEHQNIAMDMVKNIKLQNIMKRRASGDNFAHDGFSARRVGPEYRGSKS